MSIFSNLRIAVIGFIMGAADLIPGVSGGTIAFVCGIYYRLIDGLKSIDGGLLRAVCERRWLEVWNRVPWLFFIVLGTGLLTAVFTLSGVLVGLFRTHPVELWSLFLGLIFGSVIMLVRATWPWKPGHAAAFVVATIATYVLVGMPMLNIPSSLPVLFFSGAIAICAMILPGISGSYLLVIMGQYGVVLEAVEHRDFLSLGVFVAGIVTGVLSFVRVVSWLLHHHRQITMVTLTGVMAGAMRTVWPWKETISTRINSKGVEVPLAEINIYPPEDANLLVPAAFALIGAVVVLGLSRLAPPTDR